MHAQHSPLPWRQSAARGHEVLDANGDAVLTVWPAAGSPARAIADADLVLRAVNDMPLLYEVLELSLQALVETARRVILPPRGATEAIRALQDLLEGRPR